MVLVMAVEQQEGVPSMTTVKRWEQQVGKRASPKSCAGANIQSIRGTEVRAPRAAGAPLTGRSGMDRGCRDFASSIFGSQSLGPLLGPLWHTEAFRSRAVFTDVGMLLVDTVSGNQHACLSVTAMVSGRHGCEQLRVGQLGCSCFH